MSNPNGDPNDPANIINVNCYNSGSCTSPFGDNYGIGGDGTDFQQNMCKTTLKIPEYLEDGEYVMKWIVFGNGDSFGQKYMSHGLYSNCHNFRVSGGRTLIEKDVSGNKHINFDLRDNAIDITNQRTGSNIPQGQCMFHGGAVNAKTCRFQNGKNEALCQGTTSDLARRGGDYYDYMVGVPDYHPKYGKMLLLKENQKVDVTDSRAPDLAAPVTQPPTPAPTAAPTVAPSAGAPVAAAPVDNNLATDTSGDSEAGAMSITLDQNTLTIIVGVFAVVALVLAVASVRSSNKTLAKLEQNLATAPRGGASYV